MPDWGNNYSSWQRVLFYLYSIFLLFFCPNEDPKVWLEGLDFSAYATIGSFCAASGLLGAIPLPGSRFFVVPSQVMMILALAAIYKVDTSNFCSVISHDL